MIVYYLKFTRWKTQENLMGGEGRALLRGLEVGLLGHVCVWTYLYMVITNQHLVTLLCVLRRNVANIECTWLTWISSCFFRNLLFLWLLDPLFDFLEADFDKLARVQSLTCHASATPLRTNQWEICPTVWRQFPSNWLDGDVKFQNGRNFKSYFLRQ